MNIFMNIQRNKYEILKKNSKLCKSENSEAASLKDWKKNSIYNLYTKIFSKRRKNEDVCRHTEGEIIYNQQSSTTGNAKGSLSGRKKISCGNLDLHKEIKRLKNETMYVPTVSFLNLKIPWIDNWQFKAKRITMHYGVYNIYRKKCMKTITQRQGEGPWKNTVLSFLYCTWAVII